MSASKDKTWYSIASVAVFATILLTQPLYQDSMYKDSLTQIVDIQKAAGSGARSFWKNWSDIGMYGCLVLPIIYLFCF